jgi:hypothetical protein
LKERARDSTMKETKLSVFDSKCISVLSRLWARILRIFELRYTFVALQLSAKPSLSSFIRL